MMDRVRAHYSTYNVYKQCKMAEFGRRHIPGFKPELGYGYYEFTQKEFFKPHKKVILVHRVSATLLYSDHHNSGKYFS